MRPKENDYLSLTFAFKMIGYNYFFHFRLVVVFKIKKLVVNSVTTLYLLIHMFSKFANYERFFCCTGCMSGYKQKYAGRIESIKRKFEGKEWNKDSYLIQSMNIISCSKSILSCPDCSWKECCCYLCCISGICYWVYCGDIWIEILSILYWYCIWSPWLRSLGLLLRIQKSLLY
jgi:hypothetical protein